MKKISHLSWIILAPAEFFTLFQFLIQLTAGDIVQSLMSDFMISAANAALLTSAFYYIYISLQIPVGIITDKVGPRLLLSGGAFVCGIGCMIFAQTHIYWVAFAARILMGGGAAFAFVGTLYVIREWFPTHMYSFLVGFSEMLGMFWSVTGSLIFVALLHDYGWRTCFFVSGLLFWLGGLICATIIRNHNPNKANIKKNKGLTLSLKQRLGIVLRSPVAWLNGLYSGLLFSFVSVFVALWGIPFLQLKLHASLHGAALVDGMAYIGVALGCPFYGYLSQRFQKRRFFLMISGTISSFFLFLLIYLPISSPFLTGALIFFIGFSCSGYILCFAISDDISQNKMKNTFTGFTNAICMLTAPIFQPLIGYILDYRAPTGIYLIQDYQYGLTIIAFALLAGTFIAWCMPETYHRHNIIHEHS